MPLQPLQREGGRETGGIAGGVDDLQGWVVEALMDGRVAVLVAHHAGCGLATRWWRTLGCLPGAGCEREGSQVVFVRIAQHMPELMGNGDRIVIVQEQTHPAGIDALAGLPRAWPAGACAPLAAEELDRD